MNRIKHNFFSNHSYAAIALPHDVALKIKIDEPITLEQRDGTEVAVKYVDHFKFKANELPDVLTRLLFNLTAKQMTTLLTSKYPVLRQSPPESQFIVYIAVQRIQ